MADDLAVNHSDGDRHGEALCPIPRESAMVHLDAQMPMQTWRICIPNFSLTICLTNTSCMSKFVHIRTNGAQSEWRLS
jgi:hypothetical protein